MSEQKRCVVCGEQHGALGFHSWPKVLDAYADRERALLEALREIRALDVNDGLTDAEAFDCVQTIAEAALASLPPQEPEEK